MRELRVAMLTVDAAEGVSGIVDYTAELMAALAQQPVEVVPIAVQRWGFGGLRDLLGAIRHARPDLVHLQHPIVFPGHSYVPQLVANVTNAVVTTHGGSGYGSLWGKVSLGPFTLRTRQLVLTSEFERKHALGWAPWMRRRSQVIPIGSNIPARPSPTRDPATIVTFGLIRPQKGIETFLEMARLAVARGFDWRFQVVGREPASDDGYATSIRTRAAGLPIEWITDLGREDTAELLGRATVAVLPFPDGASERRGSLLACLASGTPVVTTRGAQTPRALEPAAVFARDPAGFVEACASLIATHERWEALSRAGQAYAANFTWDAIAARHVALYRRLAHQTVH